VIGRQNADIVNTLHIRVVAWNDFLFPMRYNFARVTATDMMFFIGGFSWSSCPMNTAHFEVLRRGELRPSGR